MGQCQWVNGQFCSSEMSIDVQMEREESLQKQMQQGDLTCLSTHSMCKEVPPFILTLHCACLLAYFADVACAGCNGWSGRGSAHGRPLCAPQHRMHGHSAGHTQERRLQRQGALG
jgi:hypothetical protein